jgi:hypothetical protein
MTKRFSLTTVLLFLVAVHNPAQAESLGPPATMTTVGDMGARIPIHGQGSVTITAPGSYYLTSNINVARVPAIIISSANVTVDLNGFTLTGNLDNLGVVLAHDTLNVVVRNGTIRNFAQGLINAGTTSVSLSHLTIADSLRNGVGFDAGSVGVFIDDCTIVRNQQDGILALGGTAVINNSTVASNGFDGIESMLPFRLPGTPRRPAQSSTTFWFTTAASASRPSRRRARSRTCPSRGTWPPTTPWETTC